MNSEELRQIDVVPHYVLNEKRYFQREGWPLEDQASDDLGDLLCDPFEITIATDNLCPLCRSTFSEKFYRHLSRPEGRFQHHRWSQLKLCSRKGCRLCNYLSNLVEGHMVSPVNSQPIIMTRDYDRGYGTWTSGSVMQRGILKNYKDNMDYEMTTRHAAMFLTNIGLHTASNSKKIHIHVMKDDSGSFFYSKLPQRLVETTPDPIPDSEPSREPILGDSNSSVISRLGYWKHCLPTFAVEGNPAAEFELDRGPNLDDANSYATNKIRSWLNACSKHHPNCHLNDIPTLPTRVVDVQAMRLHTSLPGEAVQYTALSYCWGGDQPYKTTKQTLLNHLDKMPEASMPKTLQDAVSVTRQLGIRYLWIDSLCIIQDDLLDVAKELSTMQTVYKNATIVIAAEFPTNVHQGFLHPQRLLTEAIRLPFSCRGGVEGSICLALDRCLAEYEALNTRAWAFQEAVLARRLLIYSRKGLIWSCISDHIQSDAFEPRTMNVLVQHRITARRAFGHPEHMITYSGQDLVSRKDGLEAQGDQLHIWYRMVDTYTHLSLTFSQDRLPALAGIAQEFQSIIADRYVAGLWARNVDRQLAWERAYDNGSNTVTYSTEYRAPSWSWASIMGGVNFDKYHGRYDQPLGVQVLDCQTEPLFESAPFGRVKSGFLEVLAFLCTANDLPPQWLAYKIMDRGKSHVTPSDCDLPSKDIPCMIIGFKSGENRDVLEGLFLEPLGAETYRRIGLFRGMWFHGYGSIPSVDQLPKGTTKQRLIII